MKRQYVIDCLIVAVLVLVSVFLYRSGKGYSLIFDNRSVTIAGKTYPPPGYIRITVDGKGRPLEIMENDRDIMTVKGKTHLLRVEVLAEDEETVLSTVEKAVTVRFEAGNLLSIPAFLGGAPDWNQQIAPAPDDGDGKKSPE